MAGAANDIDEPTAAQLAAWVDEQGVTLDEMRARVAGNRAATVAAVMRMDRMVEEAGARAAAGPVQRGESQG